jgi:uncharacterized protein YutD
MQNKEIDPFGYYIVGAGADNFLKVAHFIDAELRTAYDRAISNLRDYTVKHNDFGTGFTPLKLAMYMNWLMLVGVEHNS